MDVDSCLFMTPLNHSEALASQGSIAFAFHNKQLKIKKLKTSRLLPFFDHAMKGIYQRFIREPLKNSEVPVAQGQSCSWQDYGISYIHVGQMCHRFQSL
jgi:hypothetical protein